LNRFERIPYRALQWFVAAFALLHNLEEALTMPAFAPVLRERASGVAPPELQSVTEHLSWFYAALAIVTIIPLLVVIAAGHWRNRATSWAVVLVQSIFLVNVFVPHVPAAMILGGYAPGIVTAVAIQLPFSAYFLKRSVQAGVVSPAGVLLNLVVAVPALLLTIGAFYWSAR
jgi:hypothetical protein